MSQTIPTSTTEKEKGAIAADLGSTNDSPVAKTVYVVGAGFSRAISDAMPLLGDLGALVAKGLREPPPARTLQSISTNIEQALSRLASFKPWLSEAENWREKALFLDIANAVRVVLERQTKEAIALLHCDAPHWLVSLIHHWHRQQAAVISLNYDTVIEQVASEVSVGGGEPLRIETFELYPIPLTPAHARIPGVFLPGETSPTFRLLKLHGSINWWYSGSQSFSGETIYFTGCRGGLSAFWREEPTDIERHEKRAIRDKIPLIIPPASDKSSFFQHETLRAAWYQAQHELSTADRIVFMGYSLPATDSMMVEFLRDVAHVSSQPKKIEVVDLREMSDHYRAILLSPGFDVGQRFCGDGAIEAFVRAELP